MEILGAKCNYRFGELLIADHFLLVSSNGGLAQLARALDLHSRGHRFDSDILHFLKFSFKISEVL